MFTKKGMQIYSQFLIVPRNNEKHGKLLLKQNESIPFFIHLELLEVM